MADPDKLALLKRSVEEWNAWRKANPDGGVDLSGAYLVGGIFRPLDLHNADLHKADLHDADLHNTDLHNANLSGVDLRNAIFREANLEGATFCNATFAEGPFADEYSFLGTPPHSPSFFKADLTYADFSGTYLGNSSFSSANLRNTNFRNAGFIGKNLSEESKRKRIKSLMFPIFLVDADLRNADLSYAIFKNTDLRNADLRNAHFYEEVRLDGVKLDGAKLDEANSDILPHKNTQPEPHPSQSSTTTDWLSLVGTYGSNLLLTAATLASIIQGLDVVERRWREHQEKHKQQGAQTPQPVSASSPQPAASDKEITEIRLVMDDGSHHSFTRWISDPDELLTYIEAFSDPTSKTKPLQVTVMKRVGRALVVNITEGGKDNKQLNVILGYLDADPL